MQGLTNPFRFRVGKCSVLAVGVESTIDYFPCGKIWGTVFYSAALDVIELRGNCLLPITGT